MLFFFQSYDDHRDLHSFPTRRSSDLKPPSKSALRGTSTPWLIERRCASFSCSSTPWSRRPERPGESGARRGQRARSEEHTSELQSRLHLVCRLLLEKKKKHS